MTQNVNTYFGSEVGGVYNDLENVYLLSTGVRLLNSTEDFNASAPHMFIVEGYDNVIF